MSTIQVSVSGSDVHVRNEGVTHIAVSQALVLKAAVAGQTEPSITPDTVVVSMTMPGEAAQHLNLMDVAEAFGASKVEATPSSEMRVSESKGKGKKAKNPRSAFLSAFMKIGAGDLGNAMAEAFVGGDESAFRKAFFKVQQGMVEQMDNKN